MLESGIGFLVRRRPSSDKGCRSKNTRHSDSTHAHCKTIHHPDRQNLKSTQPQRARQVRPAGHTGSETRCKVAPHTARSRQHNRPSRNARLRCRKRHRRNQRVTGTQRRRRRFVRRVHRQRASPARRLQYSLQQSKERGVRMFGPCSASRKNDLRRGEYTGILSRSLARGFSKNCWSPRPESELAERPLRFARHSISAPRPRSSAASMIAWCCVSIHRGVRHFGIGPKASRVDARRNGRFPLSGPVRPSRGRPLPGSLRD